MKCLTESSAPGSDLLARWPSNGSMRRKNFAGRVVKLRIAMVVGSGGALAKMLPPFKLGIGGRIGDGSQWMSWIHLDDLVALIMFLIVNPRLRGR